MDATSKILGEAVDGQLELPRSLTEVAAAVGELVNDRDACSDAAARDLFRLLTQSLAVQSPAERRHRRLGLLIELVAEGGEFIPTTRYEKVRLEREAQGQHWPNAGVLTSNYRHWVKAVEAAARFWFVGGDQHVPDGNLHAQGSRRHYEPKEIVAALREAKSELELKGEDWPTQWEYREWARIKRRLARRSGTDGLGKAGGKGAVARGRTGRRWPDIEQIRKAFDTYDEAVRVAHRTGR
jgi:hypothetical protein